MQLRSTAQYQYFLSRFTMHLMLAYHLSLTVFMLLFVIVPYYVYGLYAIDFSRDPDKYTVPSPLAFFPYSTPIIGESLHGLAMGAFGAIMLLTPITLTLSFLCWRNNRQTISHRYLFFLLLGVCFCAVYFLYIWLFQGGNINDWLVTT